MAYRNKTYVAFDGDNDILYYRLMTAWEANDNMDFDFHDAHELNTISDTSSEEETKRKLRERMNNSKLFLLLVGKNTKNLFKFVGWEIDVALEKDLPIIVVNLNGKKRNDNDLCPEILKDQLAIHVPFKQKIIEHAIDTWIDFHNQFRNDKKTGPYHYNDDQYKRLGIE